MLSLSIEMICPIYIYETIHLRSRMSLVYIWKHLDSPLELQQKQNTSYIKCASIKYSVISL